MSRYEVEYRFAVASGCFDIAGIRITKAKNFGLDRQEWSVWIVAGYNTDETLVMAGSGFVYLSRHLTEESAKKAKAKYERWLADWLKGKTA